MTEELWQTLAARFPGPAGLLAQQRWPTYDASFLVEDELEIPVQINGKLRDKLILSKDAPSADYEAAARASAKVQEHLGGQAIKKVIVVPGKMVNIVV